MTPQKVKEILSKHFPDRNLTEDALRYIANSINKSIRDDATKTFESHGFVWTRHKPGDPIPCKPDDMINYIMEDELTGSYNKETMPASVVRWDSCVCSEAMVVGWRYANKKIVKLGPSDIPAGSMFRFNGGEAIFQWTRIKKDGINFAGDINAWYTFEELKNSKLEINRPKHRDADGYPTLWEPCSKEEL